MKPIKQVWQSKFPKSYTYCRKVYLNSYNHLLWLLYYYQKSGSRKQDDPYNEKFWSAQEEWEYENFARVLISNFKPSSILDVGCGSGTILSALECTNSNLRLLGMDNSPKALEIARKRELEIKHLNVVELSQRNIYPLCKQLGAFDLTLCLEVAEHLPFWHVNKLLQILTGTSGTVVFSAAQPGQGGILHLNEQPSEYWIRKFSALNYRFDSELSMAIREELNNINIPSWYKTNLLIFHRA